MDLNRQYVDDNRGKRKKMKGNENHGLGARMREKTEMDSAVNIGVNRGAIGMNRSGMTLLPDLNLFCYRIPFFFFFFTFHHSTKRVKFSHQRLFVFIIRSFISIAPFSSEKHSWKKVRKGRRKA